MMNKSSIFILFLIILSAIMQLSLMSGNDWLQYARPDIEAGQWWRFLTGNLVHLTWRHFAMNMLALVAIFALYPHSLKFNSLFLVFLLSCLSVTLGIWMFSPEIQWYVGLSGALHGLLITLIILDFAAHKHLLNIVLLIAVIAKLAWEGMMGPMPGSESTAGGPVVVQAHLYGFLGGLMIAICIYIFSKNKKL
jgi:rhomboid family GlyGly-CTERM serine protease